MGNKNGKKRYIVIIKKNILIFVLNFNNQSSYYMIHIYLKYVKNKTMMPFLGVLYRIATRGYKFLDHLEAFFNF